MSTVRTQIVVGRCADCPFFERTVLNFVSEFVQKQGTRGGACRYNGLGQSFPLGRMPVTDENDLPQICPLRVGDCLIQIKLPS